MVIVSLAYSTLLASLLISVLAQYQTYEGPNSNSPTQCTYSCPTQDVNRRPLIKRRGVIGFDSVYSVFECVYNSPPPADGEHKCSYNKPTGFHILGYEGDPCPPFAIPCGSHNSAPQFSDWNAADLPPWVEGDRYLLHLKEHHRG